MSGTIGLQLIFSRKIHRGSKSTPIALKLSGRVPEALRGYPRNINTQNSPKTLKIIKVIGVFSTFLSRVNFRVRDESSQITW